MNNFDVSCFFLVTLSNFMEKSSFQTAAKLDPYPLSIIVAITKI